MPRHLWKGSISFGLVNIPVGLLPAVTSDPLPLRMVDKRDLSPIGYRKYNKTTGAEVPAEEVAKAFQLDNDQLVLVTDEELRKASPERTQTIEIVSFVSLDQIRPAFYETPYYLEPLAKAARGYALLREALHKTRKAGIARVVIRSRERLAALYPDGHGLVLDVIRFSKEIRDPKDLQLPGDSKEAGVTEKELALAQRLVEDMIEPWKPEKYRDEFTEELQEFIRNKGSVAAPAATARTPAAPGGSPPDLMLLLKQSVAKAERKDGRRGTRTAG